MGAGQKIGSSSPLVEPVMVDVGHRKVDPFEKHSYAELEVIVDDAGMLV